MFKFAFDLPVDEGGGVAADQNTSPDAEASADHSTTENGKDQKQNNDLSIITPRSKPATSVLNMSDAISSVFESDTLFEYVPLLREHCDGVGDENGAEDKPTPAIKPLRRVVFPPDQKFPPSLTEARTAIPNIKSTEEELIDRVAFADTDLIPGVYEGGLKVWECSLDLCRHLTDEIFRLQATLEEKDTDDAIISTTNDVYHALSKNGKTLELGCGHGLPACLIFRELRKRWENNNKDRDEGTKSGTTPKGVSTSAYGYSVLFSDYNEFVLRDATVPNIILNMDSDRPCPNEKREWEKVRHCVRCVSGDWMDLSNQLQTGTLGDGSDTSCNPLPLDGRFDLILAAETTYTEESAKDTAKLLSRHLKVETGVGLVATKRYYFGVGGGADAFCQASSDIMVQVTVNGESRGDYRLSIETVKSNDSGVGRDILRVRLMPVNVSST